MSTYPLLPAPAAGSTPLQVFAFVLSSHVTATVDTLSLARALAASSGLGRAPYSPEVRARVTEARRRIVMTLEARRAEEAAARAVDVAPKLAEGPNVDGGTKVPAAPFPPRIPPAAPAVAAPLPVMWRPEAIADPF